MLAKAAGTLTSAGCATTAPSHPAGLPPSITVSTADAERTPPIERPATAPGAVRPRHQMPSSRSGQKVDAATAKASSTACATASPEESRVSTQRGGHGQDAGQPERRDAVEPAAQQVLAEHPADRDDQS